MSDDNTHDGPESSPASGDSHGDERRAAFERWADGDGCLRTIKKKNGSYLDGPTRWAWEGWKAGQRAARLADAELEAIEAARDILREMGDDNGEPFAEEVKAISGLLERLG